MVKNIAAIGIVYVIAAVGWMVLGSTIDLRTSSQDGRLKESVGELWGTPLEQRAPKASLEVERALFQTPGSAMPAKPSDPESINVPLVRSKIEVGLDLEQRQKGLLWYSMFKARVAGRYVFENIENKRGTLAVSFAFPSADGIYDDFKFQIDGKQVPFTRVGKDLVVGRVDCGGNSRHQLDVNYSSQGLDRFLYRLGDGINEVKDFSLSVATDFGGYDYPANTLAPSRKEETGNGWELEWKYSDLISGSGIGVEMPQKLNPGPIAARISYFAPVSLGFFFFLIFIISMVRGIRIHPMNYFFLAASFFAFHLLLAYLVDHISIHTAFFICSVVSMALVLSYMRIVVGARFAFVETAIAQFIYLIGFSYAFFFEGVTGLAVTIGAIITLFVVMQTTARINWSQRFQIGRAATNELTISSPSMKHPA
ncbi:MAG: inner membrane CreD family protein [Acidobacteriota bacterium]